MKIEDERYLHYGKEDSDLCELCDRSHDGDTGECACGGEGEWVADPYAQEIGEVNEYRFMCDECYTQSCMDI